MGEHFYLQEKNMNSNDRQIYLKEREKELGLVKEPEVRLLRYFRNMKMHSLNARLFSKHVLKMLFLRHRILFLQYFSGLFQLKVPALSDFLLQTDIILILNFLERKVNICEVVFSLISKPIVGNSLGTAIILSTVRPLVF